MSQFEPLADAVSRLLDVIFEELSLQPTETHGDLYGPALREAVELARRAYVRERVARDEFYTDFPQVCEVTDV